MKNKASQIQYFTTKKALSTAQKILKQYWHFDSFRDLQAEIIDCVMAPKDCIALLPTGGGKSLCYQIPALLLDGITIVVSPLISLMQDQVSQLQNKGIEAEFLHSGLKFSEVEHILDRAAKDEIKLLYISPERIKSRQFAESLPHISVALIAVDEAHCISQWGHDFRPEYLSIKTLREACKSAPIIALTASATQQVLEDIQQQLGIKEATIFRKSFKRENIFYNIRYSENKVQDVVQFLANNNNCSIVYCRSRRKTEELALLLNQNNIDAIAYHAGMPSILRSKAQQDWMNNKSAVIVATTAFGMGIDKADVHTVIHFDGPEHLEAYYQETGRAGRDGKPSLALTLFNNLDIDKLKNSTQLYFPPTDYLRKVYQNVCDYLQIPTSAEPNKYYDFDLTQFLINFKLEAVPASHSLKLLSQEGLWTLSESLFRPATVQVLVGREYLDELENRYPMLSKVTTGLLRLYSGIFHFPASVQNFQLARFLGMKKDDVERALGTLHQMGIIEYIAAKEGPQLYFHHYRVPSQNLLLNTKRINLLRNNHQFRSEKMIEFLINKKQCSNKILLQYFDEQTDESCTHCAICKDNSNRKLTNSDLKNHFLEILKLNNRQTLNELLGSVPADRSYAINVIRKMIDDNILYYNEEGSVSIKNLPK